MRTLISTLEHYFIKVKKQNQIELHQIGKKMYEYYICQGTLKFIVFRLKNNAAFFVCNNCVAFCIVYYVSVNLHCPQLLSLAYLLSNHSDYYYLRYNYSRDRFFFNFSISID